MKTRNPNPLETDLVRVSISPLRTLTSKLLTFSRQASASPAPHLIALATISSPVFRKSIVILLSSPLSADRDPVHLQRGIAESDGLPLPVLAAHPAADDQEIVADERDVLEHILAAAHEHEPLERLRHFSALDHRSFRDREHKTPRRPVDVPAPDLRDVHALVDGLDDVAGVRLAGEKVGVRHARDRVKPERLAPAVPRLLHLHQSGAQLVLDESRALAGV